MFDKIAFVKTAWSEEYRGEPVVGKHGYLKSGKSGHELYNFLPDKHGTYYAYLPPIGKKGSPPNPTDKKGWLLVFVSSYKGKGPLTVVGFYKDATIENEYKTRPEYENTPDFPKDSDGDKYFYSVKSSHAKLFAPQNRTQTIDGSHFRRSPIIYVRGNGKNESWRKEFAKLAEEIVTKDDNSAEEPRPKLSFPDAKKRKEIEEAAVNFVCKHFERKYQVFDKQKDNLGYDLLLINKTDNSELLVEVKGTSLNFAHFYLTRNEYKNMMGRKNWRLALVTNALTKPKLELLSPTEVINKFDLEPLAYEAIVKIK